MFTNRLRAVVTLLLLGLLHVVAAQDTPTDPTDPASNSNQTIESQTLVFQARVQGVLNQEFNPEGTLVDAYRLSVHIADQFFKPLPNASISIRLDDPTARPLTLLSFSDSGIVTQNISGQSELNFTTNFIGEVQFGVLANLVENEDGTSNAAEVFLVPKLRISSPSIPDVLAVEPNADILYHLSTLTTETNEGENEQLRAALGEHAGTIGAMFQHFTAPPAPANPARMKKRARAERLRRRGIDALHFDDFELEDLDDHLHVRRRYDPSSTELLPVVLGHHATVSVSQDRRLQRRWLSKLRKSLKSAFGATVHKIGELENKIETAVVKGIHEIKDVIVGKVFKSAFKVAEKALLIIETETQEIIQVVIEGLQDAVHAMGSILQALGHKISTVWNILRKAFNIDQILLTTDVITHHLEKSLQLLIDEQAAAEQQVLGKLVGMETTILDKLTNVQQQLEGTLGESDVSQVDGEPHELDNKPVNSRYIEHAVHHYLREEHLTAPDDDPALAPNATGPALPDDVLAQGAAFESLEEPFMTAITGGGRSGLKAHLAGFMGVAKVAAIDVFKVINSVVSNLFAQTTSMVETLKRLMTVRINIPFLTTFIETKILSTASNPDRQLTLLTLLGVIPAALFNGMWFAFFDHQNLPFDATTLTTWKTMTSRDYFSQVVWSPGNVTTLRRRQAGSPNTQKIVSSALVMLAKTTGLVTSTIGAALDIKKFSELPAPVVPDPTERCLPDVRPSKVMPKIFNILEPILLNISAFVNSVFLSLNINNFEFLSIQAVRTLNALYSFLQTGCPRWTLFLFSAIEIALGAVLLHESFLLPIENFGKLSRATTAVNYGVAVVGQVRTQLMVSYKAGNVQVQVPGEITVVLHLLTNVAAFGLLVAAVLKSLGRG
ncbi:hypothetical protein HK102_013082 [Quaeritorhiza haematococci]|nr:hypothetical protein HK102_013082 [Quaeritorhiza haematococci]